MSCKNRVMKVSKYINYKPIRWSGKQNQLQQVLFIKKYVSLSPILHIKNRQRNYKILLTYASCKLRKYGKVKYWEKQREKQAIQRLFFFVKEKQVDIMKNITKYMILIYINFPILRFYILNILMLCKEKSAKGFKKLESVCLDSYLPEQRVYCLSCKIQGRQNNQFAFIPQSNFLSLMLNHNVKEEQYQEKQFISQDQNEDLQRTLLASQAFNEGANEHQKIKEFEQQHHELNETIVIRKSTVRGMMRPILDYDSMLENPIFRTMWNRRNKLLIQPERTKPNTKSKQKKTPK